MQQISGHVSIQHRLPYSMSLFFVGLGTFGCALVKAIATFIKQVIAVQIRPATSSHFISCSAAYSLGCGASCDVLSNIINISVASKIQERCTLMRV